MRTKRFGRPGSILGGAVALVAASIAGSPGALAARKAGPPTKASGPARTSSSAPAPAAQTVVIHVWPEDANAPGVAAHTGSTIARRAQLQNFRPVSDARVSELLDRSPDDLERTADALEAAKAAYKEALEENGRLRLDAAQADLQKARDSLLDAAASPDYAALRQVHLYQAIVALNRGDEDAAAAQFRSVAFLAPAMTLDKDLYAPSVQEAFLAAKKSIAGAQRGALRIEVDGARNALVIFDGVPKGNAPKTLTGIPEGEHYLEVRAAGASPQLLAVTVFPAIETPTIVTMRSSGPSLRQAWTHVSAEKGAVALARIVGADRIVLGSVRSTVTGVAAYSIRAAAFDVSLGRRIQVADTSATRDPAASQSRLERLAQQLFRRPASEVAGNGESSYPVLLATRDRFVERDGTLLTVEVGVAQQDHVFDAHGKYVSASKDANPGAGEDGFSHYFEQRAVIHARYGLHDLATLVVDVPIVAKSLTYDDGNGKQKATASGLGDVTFGVDVRLPRYETPRLALLYLATRAKMPTGASATPHFLHQFDRVLLGSGQFDLYAGVGGAVPFGDKTRMGFEFGYTSRLPGRVDWSDRDGNPHYVNVGDEEHVHLDGARTVTRFLAPEIDLDFTHRHATQHYPDPITGDDKAREMYLVNLSLAAHMQLSERQSAGGSFSYPVWGKETKTFFPLDVTGPRLSIYYGLRF